MSSRRSLRPILPLALCLLAVGCGTLPAPDRFLVVDESRRELKAVTPDESLYWVRTFHDNDQGDFEFWSEVLSNELIENRGYALIESRAVTVAGQPGAEMIFEATAEGRARGYLITLWVEPGLFRNTIHVAECVADETVFDQHLAAVRAAIAEID